MRYKTIQANIMFVLIFQFIIRFSIHSSCALCNDDYKRMM